MSQAKDPLLRRIQAVLMELLMEVDRICRANGIPYAISWGNALGALRHNGEFVPWDDDVDVTMTANDFYRFARACKTQLDTGRFYLQTKKTDPQYPYPWPTLRRNGTTSLHPERAHFKIHWGIYIDFWVTYKVPKWRWARRLSNLVTGVAGALCMAPIAAGGWARALEKMRLAAPLGRACLRILWLMDLALPATEFYSDKFGSGLDLVFHSEYLYPPRELTLEGERVFGPARLREYVSECYEDWEVPQPPEDSDHYHSSYLMDPDTDYREYLRRIAAGEKLEMK